MRAARSPVRTAPPRSRARTWVRYRPSSRRMRLPAGSRRSSPSRFGRPTRRRLRPTRRPDHRDLRPEPTSPNGSPASPAKRDLRRRGLGHGGDAGHRQRPDLRLGAEPRSTARGMAVADVAEAVQRSSGDETREPARTTNVWPPSNELKLASNVARPAGHEGIRARFPGRRSVWKGLMISGGSASTRCSPPTARASSPTAAGARIRRAMRRTRSPRSS
jgi:hypothetical protein